MSAAAPPEPEAADGRSADGQGPEQAPAGFTVTLENFQGPFDVLLSLLAKHRMDITTVALSAVTDDFLRYVAALQAQGSAKALDEASEFAVVAATLLDLKVARLLPRGEVEDEYDVELLEARDLLFARLLQYKAFKDVAGHLDRRLLVESVRIPRQVDLDPAVTAALPPLTWTLSPQQLADLAATALDPQRHVPPEVGMEHLHGTTVRVADEAEIIARILRDGRDHGFAELVADADTTLVVVVRFLALLEMFREGLVRLHQEGVLGVLLVHWDGPEEWDPAALDSEYAGADHGPAGEPAGP